MQSWLVSGEDVQPSASLCRGYVTLIIKYANVAIMSGSKDGLCSAGKEL